ncbi:hypothetical protein Geob_3735 [Geotalea daltonii FRC-32]|uniref:Uncharacterized protein n=1 Tax=Geotalea daltonii (strain DSM 22248 / JCM 15807 / FRC-32) TaxID=316067 RepID=B9M752_GEODF|nr:MULTISPECIES: hypothetical protein [Geotalea]ACM22073.1 hypothetical protein Geob_3735 [Geotalea daltonii FRC-32]
MTGLEAVKAVKERRTEKDRFVRWWRKEEDFLDYDLIERFEAESSGTEEIGGLDLLSMEDMWSVVKKVGGTRVNLVHDTGGDRIKWAHKGKEDVCSFTPENLLTILDAETRGNPVDS